MMLAETVTSSLHAFFGEERVVSYHEHTKHIIQI